MVRHKLLGGWILIVVPLLSLLLLRVLGFDGMVGQDSYAYVDFAAAISNGAGSLLHPDDFAWPVGYPLLGAILSFTGLSIPLSLQLISCLSFSGTLIFVHRILKEIYPDANEGRLLTYIIFFGFLSPYYLRSAMLTTPDVFASFLVIAGVYFIGKYISDVRFYDLLLGTMAFAFAIFARYVTVVLALPVALFVLREWFRANRIIKHFLILLIPLTIIAIATFYTGDTEKALGHNALEFWNIYHFFSNTFTTEQGYSDYFLPNIVYIFYPFAHYGFTLLGVPLILVMILHKKYQHKNLQIIMFSYIAYGFFLAGINAQNTRYLLPLQPLALILCFYGYSRLVEIPVVSRFKNLISIFFVAMQILLCVLSFKSIFERNELEQEVTQALNEGNFETDLLYSFDIDIALSSRGIPFKVINLWEQSLSAFEPGAMVLFNEEKFATQWKDRNPMKNWDVLNEEYNLAVISVFGSQWKLYRIENRR